MKFKLYNELIFMLCHHHKSLNYELKPSKVLWTLTLSSFTKLLII